MPFWLLNSLPEVLERFWRPVGYCVWPPRPLRGPLRAPGDEGSGAAAMAAAPWALPARYLGHLPPSKYNGKIAIAPCCSTLAIIISRLQSEVVQSILPDQASTTYSPPPSFRSMCRNGGFCAVPSAVRKQQRLTLGQCDSFIYWHS